VRVRLLPPPFRAPAPVLVLCASERRSFPSPRASPLPPPFPRSPRARSCSVTPLGHLPLLVPIPSSPVARSVERGGAITEHAAQQEPAWILELRKVPGNAACADCIGAVKPIWASSNLGILLCRCDAAADIGSQWVQTPRHGDPTGAGSLARCLQRVAPLNPTTPTAPTDPTQLPAAPAWAGTGIWAPTSPSRYRCTSTTGRWSSSRRCCRSATPGRT
jgi:hypothetical protein